MSVRDDIRTACFNQPFKSKIITFAGAQIELRQPPVGALLDSELTSDKKVMAAKMLCDYCFVPGTNDKVFDETDKDSIAQMPFNKEWQTLQSAISELTDLDSIADKEGKD